MCVSFRSELARTADTPPMNRTTDTVALHVLLSDGIEYYAVTLGASMFSVLVRRGVCWVVNAPKTIYTVIGLYG